MPRVYLRAFELDDHRLVNSWRRDPEITDKTGGSVLFVSSERDRRWVEDKILHDERSLYLAICVAETHEMIGYLSIINVDWRNRHAEWGGIVVGRKDMWSSGYATEAATYMLRHVFFEMGMHRFYGYWLEEHLSSIKMGEKLGFRREGVLRQSVFKHNQFYNQVVMSLLKEEYETATADEQVDSNGGNN